MENNEIILAQKSYKIGPLPFGVLKKTLPVINRIAENLNAINETVMDDMFSVIHYGMLAGGETATKDDLENAPIKLTELIVAFVAVCKMAGLEKKAMGEALAGL